jgi:hypothetical protein
MTALQTMDASAFERAASACQRWSKRSLEVARALLVDGKPLSSVAHANNMSMQHANVIRGRFIKKAQEMRLTQFMRQEAPKRGIAAMEPFRSEMTQLRDKGYTDRQIVTYLAENGVSVTATSVRNFFTRQTP